MKTFEQISVDKLREIEPATQKEWSFAMGYTTRNAFYHTLKKCVKSNLVKEDTTKKPYKYSVNDEVLK